MKQHFKMLAIAFTLAGAYPIHAGTVIDCSLACASCEKNQICYCDPGDGYLCLDKKKQNVMLELQIILEEKKVEISQ